MTNTPETLSIEKIREIGGFVPPPITTSLPSVGTFSFTKISTGDLEALAEAAKPVGSHDIVGLVRALMVAVCYMDGRRIGPSLVAQAAPEDITSFAAMYIAHPGKVPVESGATEQAVREVLSSVATHYKLSSMFLELKAQWLEEALVAGQSTPEERKTALEYLGAAAKVVSYARAVKWLYENLPKLFDSI